MLKEIRRTSRKPGESRKRWFSDANMDLFVWFDDNDAIAAYHLTYDKNRAEKAVTWSAAHGFAHLGVDEGARPGKYPASPLLVPDGEFEPANLVDLLRRDAGELEPAIADFIIAGIETHFRQAPADD